jgi:hypothetical protein
MRVDTTQPGDQHEAMRTTIEIDGDILRAARSLARVEGRSVGEVVSELARRGLRPSSPRRRSGLPTFDVSRDAAPLTAEMVREALTLLPI